ncbi:MAG: hypothetical protein QME66_04695 [Candidatus Eisenbacteria bacterium]|nr:hypothetical protein [Candidatus Eisenbacteria bacterium]
MAQIPKSLTITLVVGDEEVTFQFRPPTNPELNHFLESRFDIGRHGKVKGRALQARIDFFDLLLIGVDNLNDGDDPITPAHVDRIPMNWKNDVIFRCFEDNEVDVKN